MPERKDPLEMLPGLKKSFELTQEHEKSLRESEKHEASIGNLRNSMHANLQQQHNEKVAGDNFGLKLQAEGNAESKKQTALAERSIELSKMAIGIAIIGAGIALVSLVFS